MKFMIIVIVLSTASQLDAVDTCNEKTIQAVLKQPRVPEPFVAGRLVNNQFYHSMATVADVTYGLKSATIACGDLINEDTLIANMTLRYENGYEYKSLRIADRGTYVFETQFDGDFQAHTFLCGDDNLIGNYRCLVGESSGTTPLLNVLVNMNLSPEDIKEEMERCKLIMAEIVPDAVFVDLERS